MHLSHTTVFGNILIGETITLAIRTPLKLLSILQWINPKLISPPHVHETQIYLISSIHQSQLFSVSCFQGPALSPADSPAAATVHAGGSCSQHGGIVGGGRPARLLQHLQEMMNNIHSDPIF